MSIGIVGAGIGGLTTALLLSQQGKEVTIYERSHRLGGRLSFQEGNGYRIDQGPTIVLLPDMLLTILEEGGIGRERIPLMQCDPMYRIHYKDGTIFHKYRDKQKQIEEINHVFPGESDGFVRYMNDMEQGYEQGNRQILQQSFLRKRDFFTYRNMALLTKLKAYLNVRGMAKRYFRTDKLVDAFSLQTIYIGGAPHLTPALYTLLPYAEHALGVWYLQGGYASLVRVLEDELRQRGVTIVTNAEVEEVLVTDSLVCTGVKVGGRIHEHEAIVYNGDFPHIRKLISADVQPIAHSFSVKQRSAKRKWEQVHSKSFVPSCGTILVYLGLKRRWSEAQAHQFFLPDSLDAGMKRIFDEQRLPDDPSYYVFYPTAMDEHAAPAGESVMYMLIPCPSDSHGHIVWEREVPVIVERILDDVERRAFPGLRAAIAWQSIRTPQDARADGWYEGGSFGIAPILQQSALFRPQAVPFPVRGLYAVGASVHPGGGVPIVMQGARLLVRQLMKEMR
ncbi:phytoene desaturase family protein [Paenibacillus assamensis]|uniref:phytoene desaturase family protein n=1 Tax=Paenibacillus assamensis TaxID=311244 RepID=UPI000402AFDE|nr:phytoene desaturase family protein [Paenibacillus assamensis]